MDFPVEIFEEIVERVNNWKARDDAVKTFKELALVCRTMRKICIPYLFKKWTLNNPKKSNALKCKHLMARVELFDCKPSFTTDEELIHGLEKMDRLKELHLGLDEDDRFPDIWKEVESKNVKKVVFKQIWTFPAGVRLAKVQHVQFDFSDYDSVNDPGSDSILSALKTCENLISWNSNNALDMSSPDWGTLTKKMDKLEIDIMRDEPDLEFEWAIYQSLLNHEFPNVTMCRLGGFELHEGDLDLPIYQLVCRFPNLTELNFSYTHPRFILNRRPINLKKLVVEGEFGGISIQEEEEFVRIAKEIPFRNFKRLHLDECTEAFYNDLEELTNC